MPSRPCLPARRKTWSQSDYADFEKGVLKNLSRAQRRPADAGAALARALRHLGSAYLWALAQDSKGNLYAGGGTGAKLYRIPPDGKGKMLAELDALEIHAIAVDSKDRVYVATAPDGKVYRITGNGKPEVFYDPKAKYIWALAFDSKGDLLVATGDPGRDAPRDARRQGQGLLQDCDETHVRSMAVDANGNLIVGTDPGGLVLRVSPAGEGFVLYQMPRREVTAVAVARDGSIYAAGVGNKSGSGVRLAVPLVAAAARWQPVTVNAPGAPAPRRCATRAGASAAVHRAAQRSERRQRGVPHRAQRQSAEDLEQLAGRGVRHRLRRAGPRAGGNGQSRAASTASNRRRNTPRWSPCRRRR